MAKHFAARLKREKSATKDNISDFVYFDEKLTSINKKVTLNKARHAEVQNKLNDLSREVKLL